MKGIATGDLRIEGEIGISAILDFQMDEQPGAHASAWVTGIAQLGAEGRWGYEGMIGNAAAELYTEGESQALFSGIIQKAEAWEENGLHLIRLGLSSGSIQLDMAKKSRSWQNDAMPYGKVLDEVMEAWGSRAVYPPELDQIAIGSPVIQYMETDWEFIRRLASRLELPLYPEPVMGGAKVYAGVPETGRIREVEAQAYTARLDRSYYRMGGEEAGRQRSRYLSYEVESHENHRVGDRVVFKGSMLYVCAKECRTKRGMLEFRYVLSSPEWAGRRRRGNSRFTGLSLLGTVQGCSNETVQMKLDIDAGREEQALYPWRWEPATGNVMYMMPQPGTRVSLYFKGEEETSAIAVNCIRSGGGCAGADYRDKSLTTEEGMQLRLGRGDMGVVTLTNRVMLDDMGGISITGKSAVHIMAVGDVKIEGESVALNGSKGVVAYRGQVEVTEGKARVDVKGKIELVSGTGESSIDSRGTEKTYYLAWEHEDLSHPSNRYRDAPEQKDYDWGGLASNVFGGIVQTALLSVLAYVAGAAVAVAGKAIGVTKGMAAFSKVTAMKAGATAATSTFITGSMYVGNQMIADVVSGRVSSAETYRRMALAGSVVGFLSGASTLALKELGLGAVMGAGFAEGFAGDAFSQWILNEDGEIDWARCFRSGIFTGGANGLLAYIPGGKGGSDTPGYVNTCFAKGTLVLANNIFKKIEDIKQGDLVWSEDIKTRKKGLKRVLQVSKHYQKQLIYLNIKDDIIKTTAEHPIWIQNKAWVYASDIKHGDVLKNSSDESIVVDLVEFIYLESPVAVYNFEVEGWHTYFVSNNKILVHNKANLYDKPGWINHDTYNEIRNRFGKKGADKFVNSMKKGLVSGKGENGIKMFSGKGVEIGGKFYQYEIKVKGGLGDWRVFGNNDSVSGHIIFDKFTTGVH